VETPLAVEPVLSYYLGAPVQNNFLVVPYSLVLPLLFLALKAPYSRFGKRFRDGQYSLVSLLFAVLLLTVLPRAQPFVKVGGGHVPPVPHGVGANEARQMLSTLV